MKITQLFVDGDFRTWLELVALTQENDAEPARESTGDVKVEDAEQ